MKFYTANDLTNELLDLQSATLALQEEVTNNLGELTDYQKASLLCDWSKLRTKFFTINEFFAVTQSAGALLFNVAQQIDRIGNKYDFTPATIIDQLDPPAEQQTT